ncbi:MAG: FAD:protein FMN transferase [Opitutaceae bacterium]|jgi:thiamine biosynthesis lipoprotein|nr:FAD:protein FMN transferase [Opitutaceae bacterium]
MPPSIQSPESATARTRVRRHRWSALGTVCEIHYACENDALAARFEREAVAWVEAFESRCSRFRPDSLLSRINAAAGMAWIHIDPEMEQLLRFCGSLHQLTRGALDPTATPVLRLWDYKSPTPRIPSDTEIASALRLVGWQKVRIEPGRVLLPEPGMALDFGGWGKEYAVDAVAALARSLGIDRALIDFGHDLMAVGAAPGKPGWHIGLENPANPSGPCLGSLAAADLAVASSGDYLRGFTLGGRRYGHIIDPRTGRPVDNGCRQVTVVAPGCLLAGALSTALFILGPEAGLALAAEFPDAEARIITDTALHQSRGFYRHVVS